jgi:hypothetical protein
LLVSAPVGGLNAPAGTMAALVMRPAVSWKVRSPSHAICLRFARVGASTGQLTASINGRIAAVAPMSRMGRILIRKS